MKEFGELTYDSQKSHWRVACREFGLLWAGFLSLSCWRKLLYSWTRGVLNTLIKKINHYYGHLICTKYDATMLIAQPNKNSIYKRLTLAPSLVCRVWSSLINI